MVRFGSVSSCFAIILAIFAAGFVASSAAAQIQYMYQNIDPFNSTETSAHSINDAGTIVGSYIGSDGYAHAYEDVNGTFSTVDFQSCSGCFNEANGINNLGEIVGDFEDASGNTHAYYGTAGSFQEFDEPGDTGGITIAFAVNDKGTIVGSYEAVDGLHGFILSNGQFTTKDCPTGTETEITGINDSGDMIFWCGAAGSYEYSPAQGFVALNFPGAQVTQALGINNVGDIVGRYLGADGLFEGFLVSMGNPQALVQMNGSAAIPNAINVLDEIVGPPSGGGGFLGTGPELLDPVPSAANSGLMSGPAVANDEQLVDLGFGGRVVKGVGADGVTEVVVRIPTQNVGDQFRLTLINDQDTPSTSPNDDGALGNPGDTDFSLNQLTVSAIGVNAPDGGTAPLAFAVYRAPIDFVRQNADGSYQQSGYCAFINAPSGFGVPSNTPDEVFGYPLQGDDKAACRTVIISVENLQTGAISSLPFIILRPPVVLIHGLWGSWQDWNNFSPLVRGPNNVDSRFYVGRVSYDLPIGPLITDSSPRYDPSLVALRAKSNSLGFEFNAPVVLAQTDGWIENFKQGNNPVGIPAAAVQADIVAHSMGGDIARAMILLPGFLSDSTFGQGSIHKLITIDTPHLGSPIASALSTSETGGCVENLLALDGKFVFNTVQLDGSSVLTNGAILDLATSSQALGAIAIQNPHPLPTALIAGIYTNFTGLSPDSSFIGKVCSHLGDPLAEDLTPTAWPKLFNPQGNDPNDGNNDAIVSETSQLNGLSSLFVFQGVVHSPGTEGLGFLPPSVLDPDSATGIPSAVISLLNTAVNNSSLTVQPFSPISP